MSEKNKQSFNNSQKYIPLKDENEQIVTFNEDPTSNVRQEHQYKSNFTDNKNSSIP